MRVSLAPLDGALELTLSLPDGARPTETTALDLSAAPGVKLDVHHAWLLEPAGKVEVACVMASADRWVSGLEGAVLDGASAMTRKAGGFAALVPQGPTRGEHAVEQDFVASGSGTSEQPSAQGRHVLGFAGEPPQISLCTVVCSDHAANGVSGCPSVLASYQVRGFAPPPPPGALSRAAAWAAAHPQLAAASVVALALAVAIVLLRFRPRPAY